MRKVLCGQILPPFRRHQLGPAAVELAVVAFAEAEVAGPAAPGRGGYCSWPSPICMFKSNRRDTTPLEVWVHSCQLSMSSCSKVPDGPNPRSPLSRSASLTSGGAAWSTKTQAQISISPGPLGCQTRKEWDVERMMDRLGKTVATMGLTCSARGPRRLTTSAWVSCS